jgi:hypothetical protein
MSYNALSLHINYTGKYCNVVKKKIITIITNELQANLLRFDFFWGLNFRPKFVSCASFPRADKRMR